MRAFLHVTLNHWLYGCLQAQADLKRAKFHQPEGDHLTLLTVYESWKNNKYSVPWCFENFIQARSMRRAQDVRKQLLTIMDRYGRPICNHWNSVLLIVLKSWSTALSHFLSLLMFFNFFLGGGGKQI